MKKKLFIGLGVIVAILIIIGIFSGGSKTPVSVGGSVADVEILSSNETVDAVGMRIVHVEVRNNSDKLLTAVNLKVIYADENQKIVGTGVGTGLNIAAHTTKVVDCMSMSVIGAKSYKVQIDLSLFE